MLDHTKPYIEKIRYVDAELAGHVHILEVTLQCVLERLLPVCCAHSCQDLPLWSELTNNTLRKQ